MLFVADGTEERRAGTSAAESNSRTAKRVSDRCKASRRSWSLSANCFAIAILQAVEVPRSAGDLPVLGDAIEACFDDERQSMLELTPEPLAADSAQRDGSGKHAEGIRLFGWCSDTLVRAARRVLNLVPGWESNPRKRGEEIMTKSKAHFPGSNSSFLGFRKAILVYSDGQQSFATMHQPRDSPFMALMVVHLISTPVRL